MAKRARASKGMRIRDQLPNRHYEQITLNADITNVAYSTFDVVAGGIGPYMAWLISRVELQTQEMKGIEDLSDDCLIRWQLCTDQQNALLKTDDDNVVCTKDIQMVLTTSGSSMYEWPSVWTGPVLVASRKLTGLIDATANVIAALQSAVMIMTVWYQWVEMDQGTWLEVQQAQGILT